MMLVQTRRGQDRAGGAEPAAFPPPRAVAHFIAACREAGCAWKATAGLHQPFTQRDRESGVIRFGFMNLFAAAVLAGVHDLEAAQVEQILADCEASHFRFDTDRLAWRELAAETEQIAAARREGLVDQRDIGDAE